VLKLSMPLAAASLLLCSFAFAQELADPAAAKAMDEPATELDLAFEAAKAAAVTGPSSVLLADQAKLDLPEGYVFVPKKESDTLMLAMGNSESPGRLGTVWSAEGGNWFVVISFVDEGYIKDEEAKDWDVDAMLDNFKEGTEEQNKLRAQRGMAEMEITGWVEKPAYDAAMHRLVWSIGSRDKGADADAEQGVNYNTYALGREGYISLNLVTGMSTVETEKPLAKRLLAAVSYNDGKGYGDFNAGTDKVATYGIAALIGGVAAKKLGLLAMAGVFLVKAWKLILIGLVAFGSLFGKFFGKKNSA